VLGTKFHIHTKHQKITVDKIKYCIKPGIIIREQQEEMLAFLDADRPEGLLEDNPN
jgi:hypothetical protein